MTLHVVGAGFGRTGTNSLKVALELLGFGPCYHMFVVPKNPSHIDLWNQANKGQEIKWKKLFKEYKSAVDWPVCAFLEELIHIYPTAKVVLTQRDPAEWFESANSTIFNAMEIGKTHPNPQCRKPIEMASDLILNGIFAGKYRDRKYAINIFEKHVEKVIQIVPVDRLLQFRVEQGWEPLCNFLDVPIPSEPFPWVNDRMNFKNHRARWAMTDVDQTTFSPHVKRASKI